MKKFSTLQNAEELDNILGEHFNGIDHTTAPYYLKYPDLDLIIEQPITPKRYKYILKAKENLDNVRFIMQAMNLLLGNYEEYLIVSKKMPAPWQQPIKEFDLFTTLIGRKISNLLSSCFAYIEHTKKLYHRVKSSPPFNSLKEKHIANTCSILEEVRNYAQHTGLPIHQIQIHENTCNIFVHLDILKSNKFTNMSLINNFPESMINLTAIIPNYINSLWLLHAEIMASLAPTISSGFKIIELGIEEIRLLSKKEKLNRCLVVQNQGEIIEKIISFRAKEMLDLYDEENQILYAKYFK